MPQLHDLAQSFFTLTNFKILFAAILLDWITGTSLAIKNHCWNSQFAKHGAQQFLSVWLPLIFADYLCQISAIPEMCAIGTITGMYVFGVNLGSAFENIGMIKNDTTITNCGKIIKMKVDSRLQTILNGDKENEK